MATEHQAWIVREYVIGRSQVTIARDVGVSQAQICAIIENFCRSLGYPVKYTHYGLHRMAAAERALAHYQGEFTPPSNDYTIRFIYSCARQEHVWLLRAEGLTLQQIGDRIGVSRERARQILYKFSRKVQRATRKTRWSLEKVQ